MFLFVSLMSGFFGVGEGFVDDGDENVALVVGGDEFSFDGEFMSCESHSFFGDFSWDAGHFEEYSAGFNDGDPIFWGTFTGAHTGFGGLSSHGLIRENFNPNLSASSYIPGQVVRSQFDRNFVAGENADEVHADFAGNVRQNLVTVLKLDLEHRVR